MSHKILFISSWFPTEENPTNGNFVQRHAEAASTLQEVEILHAAGVNNIEDDYFFDDQTINGVRTLKVYYKNSPIRFLNFFNRWKAYSKGFQKMQKPDLVHASVMQNPLLYVVWLKLRYGIPYVVSEHWSAFLRTNQKKNSPAQLLVARIVAFFASYVLPVSETLKSGLEKKGFKNNFHVVGNVVDTDLFSAKNEKAKEPFVFLHVSNLVTLKNANKIIEAANRLRKDFRNFELHIGGDGDLSELNALIYHLKAADFIKTFGYINQAEVSEKMRKSDFFILFSDYETFSCVALEALSSGTPVIATPVGVIPEVLNHVNGIVVNHSEEALYEAMKTTLIREKEFAAPEIMHQFVENHFSKGVIAEKFSKIYHHVLSK